MVCGYYGLNIDLFNFRQRFGSPLTGLLTAVSKQNSRAGWFKKPCASARPR
ncbi:hypothetical protein LNO19_08550 [Klebsiella quasipneumoniae subsp. similipneumoniae]|nr:hypothetical protein [Klebsiella quasipneumoniae subsp. similipneumoniae]